MSDSARPKCSRSSGRTFWRLLAIVVFLMAFALDKVELAQVNSLENAMNYLLKYGHINKARSPAALRSQLVANASSMSPYILKFQRFAGLRQTGELDAATHAKMSLSRCGNPDVFPSGNRRKKRFGVGGHPWQNNVIQYYFFNYTNKLDQGLVRSIVAKATQLWSNVSSLVFVETTSFSAANIILRYARLGHGDGYPFDGPSGTLAHTFLPNNGPWSGESHYDEDETWTDGNYQGTNLLQVTVHEIGHALGLDHSPDANSIMQPFYTGYNPNLKLGQDDINGIVSLYGPFGQQRSSSVPSFYTSIPSIPATAIPSAFPSTSTSTTTIATTVPVITTSVSVPVKCMDATVDAIVTVDNAVYVFRGNQYMIMDCCDAFPASIRQGYPRLLRDDWPGLNVSSIDAAVYLNNSTPAVVGFSSTATGSLYLFSGQQYFRYSDLPSRKMDPGYPRNISTGFPGVPDNIDTAFVWGETNQIYFIKGSLYYRYVPKLGIDRRFPKVLALWSRLPVNQRIDAAFRSPDMKTYFFSGTSFYQFDDNLFRVGEPLSTARYWFNCTSV